ncbi:relaxase/mobilization nuclease domain-containing protein [Bifidobacterium longum]|nr:relaxase/mobilization nuclease domain-containing protein [Bifidobacterium longum]MBU9068468.1 relaxase/mobilization nuclease domain-containing protein [Bifidobacterium longum]
MAVVKLGNKVKTNLPDTIRYVINPEKNDGGRLVYASYSSERHDANTLAEPMIRDLERCANGLRKDGVLALHLKHSFSPDEHVSAEQVHELGVMLTEAITGGDYKYVVSTHMDRHHLHNHIVICAANRRTGRKMRLTRRSIDRWRAVSDELCRREGLAVLENPKVETAVEHDEMLKAMRHAPDQSSGRQFGVESPVIASTGVGADMGELYAAARGVGVKERLRILIDLDAARANSIGELAELLDSHGVGLTLHGGGVTFMDRATGRRFRGARLGPAYSLDALGMRLSDGGSMLHLTFNNRLVAAVNDRFVSVWLPGTKRRRKVNLPVSMLRRDGSTWHLLMPATFTGMLMDQSNRYAARFDTGTLSEAFGHPRQRVESLAGDDSTMPRRYAASPAQYRYYQVQARKLDELRTMAEGLNAACRLQRENGGGLAKGLRDLNAKADWAYGELRAAVVALNDVIDSHDPDLVVEAREEIERRERTLLECRRQLDAIRSVARNSGVGLPKWICKERNDEPANEHEQRNGIRSDGRHVLPDVRSDAADGAGEHHAGVGGRYDSGGGREPEAQPAGCGTSEREFDALITESRASINESAALVGESDAQEATLRSQRDGQIAQRDQEERTRVHRKGKRCDRILRREAVLEADESRVRDERERLKNERKRIREDIAEQVERESERMRRCLKESSDRQRERDRRILFALCLGVCSSMVPMLAVVMQGRWQTFADSLFDWLHMRGKQLTAVGQWLAGINARLNEIIPSGWWDRPLVFLLMLLLAAVVCGMPLLAAGGYVMVVFTTMRGWLTEGTLGVHIVLWTLAAMVGFVLAGHLAMIPHNPMGWPTWWILLTVAAHLIYLAKLAGPISRFIRNS